MGKCDKSVEMWGGRMLKGKILGDWGKKLLAINFCVISDEPQLLLSLGKKLQEGNIKVRRYITI